MSSSQTNLHHSNTLSLNNISHSITASQTALPTLAQEVDYEALSVSTLHALLDSLEKQNALTRVETKMFERHGDRVFSSAAVSSSLHHDAGGQEASEQSPTVQKRRKKSEKKTEIQGLSMEQKYDILLREGEGLVESIEKAKEEGEGAVDEYKAEIECCEDELDDMKKDIFEFKRDVMEALEKGKRNEKQQPQVNAEKVIRFFEEQVKRQDSFIEKSRLKNGTLKSQKRKIKQQLKQKEEMGQVLFSIDFDQLQIENAQYLVKIGERNEDLSKLKTKTASIQSELNVLEHILSKQSKESQDTFQDISSKRMVIEKLIRENERVGVEWVKGMKVNGELKSRLEDYQVPMVTEYVNDMRLQAERDELNERVKVLKRRIRVSHSR